MFMMLKHLILSNIWLIFGIILGICFSLNFTDNSCNSTKENMKLESVFDPIDGSEDTPKVIVRIQNATRKPSQNKETKLIRPRYYSTELGIKEKLFVGVLSSEEKINTQALNINKTITHLVDKVKFFITAQQNLKSKFNLSGIVGFTDTRHVYRPFQVIKYIGDYFMEDYDYYYIMHDFNYLNARSLKAIVEKISVSVNVYMGTLVKDSVYCDMDAGILFSNSVVKAMKDNIDWCVKNAVSEDDSENLGRCVYYSTKLNCQTKVQNQELQSFKLKTFDLENSLENLIKVNAFQNAVSVYSVLQKNDFHILNTYFTKQHLKNIKIKIDELSEEVDDWPPGQKTSNKPGTRFDIPQTLYFNTTHMFFPDDFTNIQAHTTLDLKDIKNIINAVVAKVVKEKPDDFQFSRLINGYRTFQLTQGLNYELDLAFRDLHTGKEVIKRFEVSKPLGDVEFLSKPYTTENTKVSILLPVQEHQKSEAGSFLRDFTGTIMDSKEKVVLMLVFMYQYNTTSKGNEDYFKDIKDIAIQASSKYHNEDIKIAWVSIRLPNSEIPIKMENYPVLNFALIDLSLKKIGLDNLVLILDVYAEVTIEFMNRVKMNTIIDFQIFNPIPFRQYNPHITHIETFEIHKDCGHFDREEYKYISFYGRDYVKARKNYSSHLPIIKQDIDISMVLQDRYSRIGNVFEMFVLYLQDVHGFRATEPALKVKYHDETYNKNRKNLFLGTKIQLAKMILNEEIPVS